MNWMFCNAVSFLYFVLLNLSAASTTWIQSQLLIYWNGTINGIFPKLCVKLTSKVFYLWPLICIVFRSCFLNQWFFKFPPLIWFATSSQALSVESPCSRRLKKSLAFSFLWCVQMCALQWWCIALQNQGFTGCNLTLFKVFVFFLPHYWLICF